MVWTHCGFVPVVCALQFIRSGVCALWFCSSGAVRALHFIGSGVGALWFCSSGVVGALQFVRSGVDALWFVSWWHRCTGAGWLVECVCSRVVGLFLGLLTAEGDA